MSPRRAGRPEGQAELTRAVILDAALRLFAEQGFAATSIRDIAAAAGLREGSLYYHFDSKAELLEALFDELGPGSGSDRVRARFGDEWLAKPRALLQALAREIVTSWLDERRRQFERVFQAEAPRLHAEGVIDPHAFIARGDRELGRLLGRLIEAGVMRARPMQQLFIEFIGPLLLLRTRFITLAKGPIDEAALMKQVDDHVTWFADAVGIAPSAP